MEFIKNLKLVWPYAKEQKWKIVKYALCEIISIVTSVIFPILSAKIIIYLTDELLLELFAIAAVIFFIEIIQGFLHFFIGRYSQIIYRETFTKIQIDLGKNILRLQNAAIDTNSSGLFIQRLTGDTSKLADVFNVMTMCVSGIMTNIGIFGAIFIIDKWIFLYIVCMVVLIYLVDSNRVKKRMENDQEVRKYNEKVTGFVGEIVRGTRDIKMLNAESSFLSSLEVKIKNLNGLRYRMQKTNRFYQLAIQFIYGLYDFLLILLSIYLIHIGKLSIPNALVIHNYSGRVTSIANYFGRLLDYIKDFDVSCARIFAIINGEEFPKEHFGKKHLDTVEGNFEFSGVSFSYDQQKVLKGVDFKIRANETVAFVGKSGAGKTTIFNLLCKMYEPTAGHITIDGVDIRKLDKETIRGNITIINQNPYIFNLSIRENLRLVKENLTDDEMIEACKAACLDDFINELPDGYDTIIGEGGINLSGGQKQRLAIARALVQKTEIILFDEATSALDNETQAKIQEAIENMKNEYTILIIAHRLSTIVNADRIVFLNDGKIEMEGTHRELLAKSKNYRALYESEISK